MKRWISAMIALFMIMAVAGAKLVYYPPKWDDPSESQRVSQVVKP